MCLLIIKPKNKVCPIDHMKEGFDSNDHGAGFAVVIDNEVIVEKGFFTFDSFLARYLEVNPEQQHLAMIHFRIGTSGLKDVDNCHPFLVGDSAIAHNGVIYELSYQSSKKSDTHILATYLDYLARSYTNNNTSDELMDLVGSLVGTGNKVAIVRPDGSYFIANEKQGHWDDGVWYSNTSYFNWRRRYAGSYGLSGYGRHSFVEDDVAVVKQKKIPRCRGCHKILRNPVEVEDERCVHCMTEVYENIYGQDGYYPDCTGSVCDGTCEYCQEHLKHTMSCHD